MSRRKIQEIIIYNHIVSGEVEYACSINIMSKYYDEILLLL